MKNFRYTKSFDEEYAYDGKDLGAVCTLEGTDFRLWAPFAEKVELCLYGSENREENTLQRLEMKPEKRGVWHRRIPGDLHGCYYDYCIVTGGEALYTADPYAVGCGCNGYPSMVVDLRRTDPEGFDRDHAPGRDVENIIYELHIKDFSYDPDSGVSEACRGKYKAFTAQPDGNAEGREFAPGVAYLKELGITHVHLLPFFDYGFLDEDGDGRQFNWGYDPVNYNIPEGSYATDAHDGTVRIRECKEMIQALHQAGIRVVMDVVYNHTHDADSWLERTAPGYYCRRWEDGTLANGSACGSDMAVGRKMVDNYIADSVMYWAREYHLDGFRFDLMGLLTVELMNRIRRELDQEFGKGEKLLYGEPWRADESPMESGTHAAIKENVQYLDEGIAVFSDDTRDVIKGHVFYEEEPGFVNGGKGLEKQILQAVTGWCGEAGDPEDFRPGSCSRVVNYVSAHDNFTLWDKLVMSFHGKEADFTGEYEDVLRANKLAALIYFTCQGHLFLQAGEEFGRTKLGDGNSYRSDPEINMLRWHQKVEQAELLAYYKGLIRLRKKLPGLWDKTAGAAGRMNHARIPAPGVVIFRLDNRLREEQIALSGCKQVPESCWKELFIVYNASKTPAKITLPEGEWIVLADGRRTDLWEKADSAGRGWIEAAAGSGLILGCAGEDSRG